jgi:hypothetical protein
VAVASRGIEALLAQALLAELTRQCITNVAADDESRANHVILGKPTTELRDSIVVSIHMQHPLGPGADTDGIEVGTPRQLNERPDRFPIEFCSIIWKILGAVQINVRERQPYEDAIEIIASIYERIRQAIDRGAGLTPLTDDWGNTLFQLRSFQAAGYASGGGDISINVRWVSFRGDVIMPQGRS